MIPKKIIVVLGARPNFMKGAPILKELRRNRRFRTLLVHTGQHYDREMSDSFFKELGLPKPDRHLGVGSGTHAEQTAKVMTSFEKVCLAERPELVVVVGDVNSTLAAALVAAKMGIPVAHVEAGLRSFDRTMPEEINRVLTDQVSDYLFITSPEARRNLLREGLPPQRIFFVGNVMIDTLLSRKRLAQESDILEKLNLKGSSGLRPYAVVTLHRPSNVDDSKALRGILKALGRLSRKMSVVFPVHPRTASRIEAFGLERLLYTLSHFSLGTRAPAPEGKILATPPLSYLDFLCLLSNAALVLTDSGGIQEETTILGVPCLTLRDNTERPITVIHGTNRVVGNDPGRIYAAAREVLEAQPTRKKIPKYWDGKAARRIVAVIKAVMERR